MKWLPGITALYVLLISFGCSGPDYRIQHPRAASEVLNIRERDYQHALNRSAPPDERLEATPSAQMHPPSPPAVTPADAPSEPPAFGSYHALVIGINAYHHWSKLRTAVNDAQAVAQMLRHNYGFDVTLLIDASHTDIFKAFHRLRDKLTERDNLLIYYAGHGKEDRYEEQGYWIPIDADSTLHDKWISNPTILDTLKAVQAKHVMVVADSCFAGTLGRGTASTVPFQGPRDVYFTRLAQMHVRTALLSGGVEPVEDTGGRGHSVFARAFLTALAENRAVITGQELFTKISRPVGGGSNQTPVYRDLIKAGHEAGDFLFVPKSRPLS
jgi:hypothetical protein